MYIAFWLVLESHQRQIDNNIARAREREREREKRPNITSHDLFNIVVNESNNVCNLANVCSLCSVKVFLLFLFCFCCCFSPHHRPTLPASSLSHQLSCYFCGCKFLLKIKTVSNFIFLSKSKQISLRSSANSHNKLSIATSTTKIALALAAVTWQPATKTI